MLRVVYSAGNRLGAGEQLFRFIQSQPAIELKIAAYRKSSLKLSHVDWTLDALVHSHITVGPKDLIKLLGHTGMPKVDVEGVECLFKDIKKYQPDLIISDGEPILAHLARTLQIPWWSVTPLHLLDGIQWNFPRHHYTSLLELTRKSLLKWPLAQRYYISSPWGFFHLLDLQPNFEWLAPFENIPTSTKDYNFVINDPERQIILSKIITSLNLENKDITPNNWWFLTGETYQLLDCLTQQPQQIVFSPSLKDPEALLNTLMGRYLLGSLDLGQVELMSWLGKDRVEKALSYQRCHLPPQIRQYPTLKDKVEEYAQR